MPTGLNTGVMLIRNTDWARGFIADVARLGRQHVFHWQLMDEVTQTMTDTVKVGQYLSVMAFKPFRACSNLQRCTTHHCQDTVSGRARTFIPRLDITFNLLKSIRDPALKSDPSSHTVTVCVHHKVSVMTSAAETECVLIASPSPIKQSCNTWKEKLHSHTSQHSFQALLMP